MSDVTSLGNDAWPIKEYQDLAMSTRSAYWLSWAVFLSSIDIMSEFFVYTCFLAYLHIDYFYLFLHFRLIVRK